MTTIQETVSNCIDFREVRQFCWFKQQAKCLLILLERENTGCGDWVTEIDSEFLNKVAIFSPCCEKLGIYVCPGTASISRANL